MDFLPVEMCIVDDGKQAQQADDGDLILEVSDWRRRRCCDEREVGNFDSEAEEAGRSTNSDNSNVKNIRILSLIFVKIKMQIRFFSLDGWDKKL